MSQLASMVRAKYPGAYDDLDDAALDSMVRAKYPGAYDDIPSANSSALQAANSKYTVNPDERGPVSRFVGGVASSLNPITIGKGIYQAVTDLPGTASALMDAQVDTGAKADQAEREGRGVEAAGYRLASGIPIVGPMIAGLGEQAGSGDIAGAAGSLTGAVLAPGAYGKAFQGARAAAPAVSQAVGNAAGTVGRGAVAAGKAIGPELIGAGAGLLLGGGAGGSALGGLAGNVARRVVKEWFQKRFKMSEAKATEMATKLPEAEVVRIAKEAMPEAAAPPVGPMRPSPMSGSAPGGAASVTVPPRPAPPAGMSGTSFTPVAVDPASLNQVRMPSAYPAMAQAMPEAPPMAPPMSAPAMPPQAAVVSEIRPIPPQKLPPVLPDPVVPELATTPVVVPKSTPKATVADEAAALAARQKEHIAETYRKKAAKEAKNEADSDDLLAKLEASVADPKGKPAQIPEAAKTLAEELRVRVLKDREAGLSRTQIKKALLENVLRRKDGYKPAEVARLVDMILKSTP